LATDAVARGCEARSVAVLGGLKRPTSADVEDELPALLHELGVTLPSEREAAKVAVDALARVIVAGTVEPSWGADVMRGYHYRLYKDEDISDQLWIFVGLAVEREEENRRASAIDRDVVHAASAFLESGGLRIAGGPGNTVE
jgi:hypothetical protein